MGINNPSPNFEAFDRAVRIKFFSKGYDYHGMLARGEINLAVIAQGAIEHRMPDIETMVAVGEKLDGHDHMEIAEAFS